MNLFTSLSAATIIAFASPAVATASDDSPDTGYTAFSFPGGSLPAYVEAIEATFPESSIVVMPGLETVQVPAMDVRVSGVGALASIAEECTGTTQEGVVSAVLNWIDDEVVVAEPELIREATPTLRHPSRVRVYSVPNGVELEQCLGALEAGISMVGDQGGDAPSIQYHESTGIIFVRASSIAQDVVTDTLDRLEGMARQRADEECERQRAARQDARGVMQTELEAAREALLTAEARIAELEDQLAQQHGGGQVG